MENNSSRQEDNGLRTSIIDQINSLELSVPNFSAERNSRSVFFTFFIFLVLIILSFENKFEGNGSILTNSTVSSSAFYFGDFQMNTNLLNDIEKNHIKNGLFTESELTLTTFGNSRWQVDWAKSSTSSKSAWVSLIIQLNKNETTYTWRFEKFITEDESNMLFKGKTDKIPSNKIHSINSTDCLLEIDISNDTNLFNQIFPQRVSEKYKFRGSIINDNGIKVDQMEHLIKSLDCSFEVLLKGVPFSTSLFRLNIIHFSFLYNLKVLMEIRGSVTQVLHSNSPGFGPNYVSNTSIPCLFMQIILDMMECLFILYCSFALPSLLFSPFSLMMLFKWIHIFYIEIKYLFWIWKSNYLQNTPTSEIPTITSQFYKKFYAFLFGIVFLIIFLFGTCDSSQVFSTVITDSNKRNRMIFQYIPYCIYLSLFSFLIPQILSNIFVNTNNSPDSSLPLHPQFILTSLIGKSFVPIYIWGYSNSIFNTPVFRYINNIPISTKNSPLLTAILILIISIQMIFYFFQLKFGPKCLIPKGLRPKPYNYFRLRSKDIYNETSIENDTLESSTHVVNEINSEAFNEYNFSHNSGDNLDANFSRAEDIELTSFSNDQRQFNRLCVICMTNVSVYNDLDHELCAVCTPCDHVFHQKCLKQWMRVKLECPTCRRQIPPFDTN